VEDIVQDWLSRDIFSSGEINY